MSVVDGLLAIEEPVLDALGVALGSGAFPPADASPVAV